MNQFKEKFEKDYESDIEKLISSYSDIPYGGRLVGNKSDDSTDSYGETINNSIERIYYFADFDVYIKFNGKYSSYYGERWFDYEEVRPVIKTITSFETV